MWPFDALKNLFVKIFPNQTKRFSAQEIPTPSVRQPKIHFESVTVVEKTPGNDSIKEKAFIAVVYQSKPMWALFRCPCRCGTVISLSLQSVHHPNWKVNRTALGRPTLHPSVWQNKGCFSHFWVKDGRVYWCKNTGKEPSVAEPKYYSKPKGR